MEGMLAEPGSAPDARPAEGSVQKLFAANLAVALSRMVQRPVTVGVHPSREPVFCDWAEPAGGLLCTQTMRIRGVAHPFHFVFDAAFVRQLVDLMFGGSGAGGMPASRQALSYVENSVAKRLGVLVDQACAAVGSSLLVTQMPWPRGGPQPGANRSEEATCSELRLAFGPERASAWVVMRAAAVDPAGGPLGDASYGTPGRHGRRPGAAPS